MLTTDVLVVGGGPAGAAAAITLARAGRSVTIADRATFPRDKICGDGITTLALRHYERLGLDPATVASWTPVEDFSLWSASGRRVDLPLPRGAGSYAVVARREDLDGAFLDVARRAGARVLEGSACTAATQTADGITATVGEHEVSARYLIGADGMWSPTRKLLGHRHTDGYRGEWHAFRQYFTGVGEQARRDLLVWFEPDILPGYVWSFPLGDGGANVGFGIMRGGDHEVGDMGDQWADLLDRPHIRAALGADARPTGPPRAWPIPARIGRVELSDRRALWVGDAAAAVDPMTGEGIGQALETGTWAAEAILAAGDHDPAAAAGSYERQVRRNLVPDDRMSRLLLRALRHRKGNRFPLWLADRNDWTRRNFARWLWEDYPRAAIATPRRWHRGMFTGPGAYRSPSATSSSPSSSSG